jgi:hypothetical protein
MTEDQREIMRKKRVLEYAEKVGNIHRMFPVNSIRTDR